MPRYRLVFPPPPGEVAAESHTAHIDSDEVYAVGDLIRHDGRDWRVTQAPIDEPIYDAEADLLLWPADAPDA